MAALFLAGAACSSGDDDAGLETTNTTRRSTTSSAEDSTTSSSDGDTSTSGGRSTTTRRGAGGTSATNAPTSAQPGTPGATASPVDKPALQRVATLNAPLAMAIRAGDGAVYVAEKRGRIIRLGLTDSGGAQALGTALDITDRVSTGSEQGLLGLAFSPDGSKLYASFTNTNGDSRIAEYPFANGAANKGAERMVLAVDQPYANHNGGQISFGPDGLLYVALGDGGSGGDPENRAQNLNSMLGKILRINPAVNGTQPYSIPSSNPFFGQSGRRGEIYHYGLRNPWRFSFDRANGEQWIADVGQNAWEEVNRIEAGRSGANFGWRLREGNHAFNGGAKPAGAVDPVHELSHEAGNCSITGGHVYRGTAIRGLAGTYLFGDLCRGRILGLTGATARDLGLPTVEQLASFGEDASGELWVFSLSGGVFRLVRS